MTDYRSDLEFAAVLLRREGEDLIERICTRLETLGSPSYPERSGNGLARCRVCGRLFIREEATARPNFCAICGTRLLWPDPEDAS